MVRSVMSLMLRRLRKLRWGAIKTWEGSPTPAEVVAASSFESIRSAEIFPLFQQYFQVVTIKRLGGTIQHLLYNGIIHNFDPNDEETFARLPSLSSSARPSRGGAAHPGRSSGPTRSPTLLAARTSPASSRFCLAEPPPPSLGKVPNGNP